jgi:hypothetical protein
VTLFTPSTVYTVGLAILYIDSGPLDKLWRAIKWPQAKGLGKQARKIIDFAAASRYD